VLNNCIIAVAAIRGALASDPALQKSYKASLREVKAGTFLVDQGYEDIHQAILKRLKVW
jgi:ABC-type Zn uptake system ZnuABC Zn-binding protein ZnuA